MGKKKRTKIVMKGIRISWIFVFVGLIFILSIFEFELSSIVKNLFGIIGVIFILIAFLLRKRTYFAEYERIKS